MPEATPAGLETRDEMSIVHHFYYPKRTGFFMEPFCLGRVWQRELEALEAAGPAPAATAESRGQRPGAGGIFGGLLQRLAALGR